MRLTESKINLESYSRGKIYSESEQAQMLGEKKKKIQATGILTVNTIAIDNSAIEWLAAEDFDLPAVAKGIGVDRDHKVKATISIELTEEPCILCENP